MAINIGEVLRKARESKKLTLDDLQQRTKIQKRYLEAIEQNRFAELPSTFYVRAFIRQYAAAVDVDGDHLVDVFDGKDVPARPARTKPEEIQVSRKDIHVEKDGIGAVLTSLPAIALGLVAAAIIGVVFYISWLNRNADPIIQDSGVSVDGSLPKESSQAQSASSSKTEASSTTETTASSEAVKDQVELVTNTDSAAEISLTEATDPVKLDFTSAEGRCWIGIYINGSLVQDETVEIGATASYALPAGTENATIVLGAAKYVNLSVNGQAVDIHSNQDVANKKNIKLTIAYPKQ